MAATPLPDEPVPVTIQPAGLKWLLGMPNGATPGLATLARGYFGASTGAGAALLAASRANDEVRAIVSRGGRPDLAGAAALAQVRAPTLLIVGSRDTQVIELNKAALRHLESELKIVPGAGHLFEEPGTPDQVIDDAARWFLQFLRKD